MSNGRLESVMWWIKKRRVSGLFRSSIGGIDAQLDRTESIVRQNRPFD